jgi:DNA-binding winged helix-turn-helix (wHTH) protein
MSNAERETAPQKPVIVVRGQDRYHINFLDHYLWHIEDGSKKEKHLTPKAWDVLLCLAKRPNTLVRKNDLLDFVWPGTNVSEASLGKAITELRKALDDTAAAIIENVHGLGYRFNIETEDVGNDPSSLITGIAENSEHSKQDGNLTLRNVQLGSSRDDVFDEITEFLNRTEIKREFQGQFIQVLPSPEGRGWTRAEVSHRYLGEYPCPPKLGHLMGRYKPKPPIRGYFGLHCCPPLSFADGREPLVFELYGGTWHHVYALSQIFKDRASDHDCRDFRNRFQDSWVQDNESRPLSSSPLYHNVNAEITVISSDGKVILGRRHSGMLFGGSWSVSLEEQMLRHDPERQGRGDKHLFDAAERGVREELGATVISTETRLLKVGVEWGNFTAAFLFVVRCEETFDELVRCWTNVLHDPHEAVAIDCEEADPSTLRALARSNIYTGSSRLARRVTLSTPGGQWHPTAVARLYSVANYLEYLKE